MINFRKIINEHFLLLSKKKLGLIIPLLIVLLVVSLVLFREFNKKAPDTETANDFSETGCKIGFITDLHASYSKSSTETIRNESRIPLLQFINAMNDDFHPDIVVQGGDLIDGREKETEIARSVFSISIDHFKKLKSPVLHMMGNHETRDGGVPKELWLKETGNNETYYYRDCKNTRLIILDGIEDFQNQYYALSSKQIDWLNETLDSSESKKVIVFTHVPLITRSEISPRLKSEKEFSSQQAENIKRLFAEKGVDIIISGHNEILYRKNENDVIHQVLPGVFKSKDEEVSWLHSYYEITQKDDDISIKMLYKKNPEEIKYQTLEIPSPEFDRIEK
ncbi:MAG: hypothetical protein ACD_5C00031G0005 [uncultured bacterium]|nr:MAG: hypothetical protein ACD_5C00031G0005 [uncultured bacterium]